MKTTPLYCLVLLLLAFVLTSHAAFGQQVPLPRTAAEVPGPAAGTCLTKDYVRAVGRLAYVFGYAMVNTAHRRAAMAYTAEHNGNKPLWKDGILPSAPINHLCMLADYVNPEERAIACPNQDVVYGAGYMALNKGPVVLQIPDFGDRFWVFALYDARTDEFAQLGKQYGTKPGFYLIVGPDWHGEVPAGIAAVVRSSTEQGFIAPRVFKDDSPEDTKAVQPLLNQIMLYPLENFTGKMQATDWSKTPVVGAAAKGEGGEIKHVDPETFFEQLLAVLKVVPPMPGEEALYRLIESVFQAAADNPHLKQELVASFVEADKELVAPLVQWKFNGRPAGNGWNAPVNGGQWGTDYLMRTATAISNIYENRPQETKYLFRDDDSQGQQLNGNKLYSVTFAKGQLPPCQGFWSVTLYNKYHMFHSNRLNRFSLGTKSTALHAHPDGSLTLYFGATSPGQDKESNWLPSPDGPFSLYLRIYWPDRRVLDGSWQPPNVEPR